MYSHNYGHYSDDIGYPCTIVFFHLETLVLVSLMCHNKRKDHVLAWGACFLLDLKARH